MKADSGASTHFWRPKDKVALDNIRKEKGPPVKMPNAAILKDDQVGNVPLSQHLSKSATKTRISNGLKSARLVSLVQLVDDGCTTTITAPELVVTKKDKIILKGKKELYGWFIWHTHLQRYNHRR